MLPGAIPDVLKKTIFLPFFLLFFTKKESEHRLGNLFFSFFAHFFIFFVKSDIRAKKNVLFHIHAGVVSRNLTVVCLHRFAGIIKTLKNRRQLFSSHNSISFTFFTILFLFFFSLIHILVGLSFFVQSSVMFLQTFNISEKKRRKLILIPLKS